MRRWAFWLGLFVSVIFLTLALRGIHLEDLIVNLQRINAVWILPGVMMYLVSTVIRSWRWRQLLRPVKPLNTVLLLPIVMIGYMGNNIYPARIGELLRAYVLRRKTGVPISATLATVLIERVMDSVAMLGFVLIGLQRVPALGAQTGQGLLLVGALFGLVVAALWWVAHARTTAEQLAERVLRPIPHARLRDTLLHLIARFIEGAQSLRDPRQIALCVGATVVLWLFETAKYVCVALAFDLTLPFDGFLLINGLSNLFTVIPAAPGAVGTFDAGGILAATALGVDASLAAAYVFTLHAALWVPITAAGAVLMLREGLRWADLRQAQTAETAA